MGFREAIFLEKSTTAKRLQYIMNMRHLRQVDILEAAEPYCKKYGVKLGRNALSQYVNGKVEPRQDKLTILGLALGLSEAWLMGYDVPMERETPTSDDDGRKAEYIEAFARLTPAERDFILNQMRNIVSLREQNSARQE